MTQQTLKPILYRNEMSDDALQGFLESIANLFESMLYIDLATNTLLLCKLSPDLLPQYDFTPIIRSPVGVLSAFLSQAIDKESADLFKECLTIDGARKHLETSNPFSFRIRMNEHIGIHDYQIQVIGSPISPTSFIYTTRRIDEEVKREEMLEHVNNILRAMAQEYGDLSYTLPNSDQVICFSMTERIQGIFKRGYEGLTFDQACLLYVNNGVIEDDRELMRNFLRKSYLLMKLEKRHTISQIYRNIKGLYCEAKCALVDAEKQTFVIGFAVKDEEIRAELRQKQVFNEMLDVISSQASPEETILLLLKALTQYYDADRAYLFEADRGRTCIKPNYIYTQPYREAQMLPLRPAPIEHIDNWYDHVPKLDVYYLDLAWADRETDPIGIGFLKLCQVESTALLPTVKDGKMYGFLGIDNLKLSKEDHQIAKLVAALIELQVLRRQQNEEEIIVFDKLKQSFAAVYYVDLLTDYSQTHLTTDRYRAHYGAIHSYDEAIEEYVNSDIAEEERAQVRIKTTRAYVREQLKNADQFSVHFTEVTNGVRRNCELQYIRANAEGTCAVLIEHDNTEAFVHEAQIQNELRIAKEQAESSNRSKSTFLFNMSHDIRTPLNAIKGFTELAKRHQDDKERLSDYLDKIGVSNTHLTKLINDVLDMARIESGAVKISRQPVDLLKSNAMILPMAQSLASEKGIELKFDASGVQAANVCTDQLHLNQILLNILSNAIKYTRPNGHVQYTIAQQEASIPGRAAFRFTIKDDGIGMSEDFLKHIFEQFTRERSTTESKEIGTGLGMSIVKHLVDLLGGQIAITSEVDRGTTVRLDFEFDKVEGLGRNSIAPGELSIDHDLTGLRILIAEDNPLNREIAVELLEDFGFEVDTAENGQEAVQKIEEGKAGQYDVILMDIQMPVMDGYEATQKIRQLKDCPLSTIPIIAMTANAFEEDRKRAIASGMNDHLAKPLDIDAMLRIIRRHLN